MEATNVKVGVTISHKGRPYYEENIATELDTEETIFGIGSIYISVEHCHLPADIQRKLPTLRTIHQ